VSAGDRIFDEPGCGLTAGKSSQQVGAQASVSIGRQCQRDLEAGDDAPMCVGRASLLRGE
jgi:hypothetical protein